MPKKTLIDPLSVVSLFLECCVGHNTLAAATGFIVEHAGYPFIMTNWHVVSGRDPSTNQSLSENGALPDTLAVWHHIKGRLGTWERRWESLKNPDGSRRWLEHAQGRRIDVVALPVTVDDEIQVYPLDLSLADTDLQLSPSEAISIIGFPFGLASAGRFPIWKTGHLASDLDLDYDGLPMFIVDATTRHGMSGSPVVARRIGMYRSSQGMEMGGSATRFLGIYSGRIHGQAEIGMVWRPEVVLDVLKQGPNP